MKRRGVTVARLEIRLLGAPEINVDGNAAVFDTRKAVALLAYLATTGQTHTRDAVAALLWPDYDQTSARGALRRTLSTLNKALAGDWLAIERETIGLNPQREPWIDLQHFQQALDQCRQHGHGEAAVCARCLPPLHTAVGPMMVGGGELFTITVFEQKEGHELYPVDVTLTV